VERVLERALRRAGERQSAPPRLAAFADCGDDCFAERPGLETGFGEHAVRPRLLDGERTEQEVLGPDPIVTERARFVARGGDDRPRHAREAGAEAAAVPATARGPGRFGADDLMHALVRETELLRDLAQRSPGSVEPSDRVVEIRLRPFLLVAELEEPVAHLGRLGEDLLV
jgi:hypothetical protein